MPLVGDAWNNLLAMIGMNQTPTGSQLQTASQATGIPANQFAGFGQAAQQPNPVSAATNTSDPSSLASWIGSAPRSSVGTGGGGLLGGLTSFLTNPLTQAAANTYFTAASQPHGTSRGARLALGGMAGMKTLSDQEQQAQLTDPYLQQQLERGQQQLTQGQLQTELDKRQAARVPPSRITALDQYAQQEEQAANAITVKVDPTTGAKTGEQEKAYHQWNAMWMRDLANSARNNLISNDALTQALQQHDVAKEQNQLYASMVGAAKATNMQLIAPSIPGLLGSGGATVGSGGGVAPPVGAPGAGFGVGPGAAPPADSPVAGGATPPAAPPGSPDLAPVSPATGLGTIPGTSIPVIGLPKGRTLPPDLISGLSSLPPDFGFTLDVTGGANNVKKVGANWQIKKADGTWYQLNPGGPPTPVGPGAMAGG